MLPSLILQPQSTPHERRIQLLSSRKQYVAPRLVYRPRRHSKLQTTYFLRHHAPTHGDLQSKRVSQSAERRTSLVRRALFCTDSVCGVGEALLVCWVRRMVAALWGDLDSIRGGFGMGEEKN